ncbi:MAG: PAS domain-containing protein, partial [Candidatus Omnitrophica bacterium]|nr:PAS domain-containing protein [Candidatus Omnitrophota bacterium]
MNEIKFKDLLENLPQRIFAKDLKSAYTYCNKNYADDLGISPEDIKGKTDHELHPKDLADIYKADDEKVINSGQGLETELMRKIEGKERIVKIHKIPIKNEHGKVVGELDRFKSMKNYVSYCRLVESKKTSNNKKKGKGNSKCGNKFL